MISLSRRGFIKGVALMAGLAGMKKLTKPNEACAAGSKTLAKGDIGIEWLGHGSFQFTSCKGMKILLDPWFSTNPKCPTRFVEKCRPVLESPGDGVSQPRAQVPPATRSCRLKKALTVTGLRKSSLCPL